MKHKRPPLSRLLLLSLLALTPFFPLQVLYARPGVSYGPVPADIAGVAASERDLALANSGLNTLLQGSAGSSRGGAGLAVALLIMLDDVGLKAVATQLARGGSPAGAMPRLLEVVASSEHPAADVLLERAAQETRPILRMLAADGLGRGRSPRAVPALARLTADRVPAVRIAALRSLFAIESPQAQAARMAAPRDRETDLLVKRLLWHRRCEDVSPAVLALATEIYLRGTTVDLRMAAAQYLTMPGAGAPTQLVRLVLREMGTSSLMAAWMRTASSQPTGGYDAIAMRRTAIEAALLLLARPDIDKAARARLIDHALGWLAHPVPHDSYSKEAIPEDRLRRRLPDLGEEILAPTLRRLRRGDFKELGKGITLIRELELSLALPALRSLLVPRTERPPFESDAEAGRRRFLRNMAAGALEKLGRFGDERLARALLFGPESESLKEDILWALEAEPDVWAVPLLGEVVAGAEGDLRTTAIYVLEKRLETSRAGEGATLAHKILIDDLFARMERPYDRLAPLVHAGDQGAITVLKRALSDERSQLRKAGLSQFRRRKHPRLCGAAGRAALLDFTPDPGSRLEIQDYVYALLNTDPERAVAYVHDGWSGFPTDRVRMSNLRLLGDARGKQARPAALRLALEKAVADAPLQMLMSVAAVLKGPSGGEAPDAYGWAHPGGASQAFWLRLLDDEDWRLQREAIQAYTHARAPDATERLLLLLSRALAGKAMPPLDSTRSGEQEFACLVLSALPHHDWTQVEPVLIDVATMSFAASDTRTVAAHELRGRLTEEGRQRLIRWLDYTKPPAVEDPQPEPQEGSKPAQDTPAVGINASLELQAYLAVAVGQNADAAVAATLFAAVEREIYAFYSPEQMARLSADGPRALKENHLEARIVALARGIGYTGHEPSIEALLHIVFDARFAAYARVLVKRQAASMREATPASAALTPSSLSLLTHRTIDSWSVMPSAVWDLLRQVKILDDDKLAAAMERVLHAARADGRLSQFPALYFDRILQNVLDPHSGRKLKTGAVVLKYAARAGPLDAPVQYQLADQARRWLAQAGRFAEALAEQRKVVRIIARGNHDDRSPGLWRLHRSIQDSMEGAAAAQRARISGAGSRSLHADNLFLRASLRGTSDPEILNTVAWYRARVDWGLEEAEALARRATTLESRIDSRRSANAADTLAYVLLKRGRPLEGLAVLAPRMRESTAKENGLLWLHMGQLYASGGDLRSAASAIKEALCWDRALEPALRTDPFLAPLRERIPIKKLAQAAERLRLTRR